MARYVALCATSWALKRTNGFSSRIWRLAGTSRLLCRLGRPAGWHITRGVGDLKFSPLSKTAHSRFCLRCYPLSLVPFHLLCKVLFWLCAAEVLYTFAGYPVVLVLLACLHQVSKDIRYAVGRGERRKPLGRNDLPSISLVFAAHNEAAVIAEKMRNCASLDYPSHLLEVVVGCDSCDDGTAALARECAVPNLRVEDYPVRQGKPGVLNKLVPGVRGDVVVLSDANTILDPGAVLELARYFTDPNVGSVCGELRFIARDGAVKSEGIYWRYEQILKFYESRMNMLVGANGGVYAIRRELFATLPRFAIIDDFLIAMQIRGRGYRVLYAPEAIAYEETGADARQEFERRIRIGAGAFHALRYTWKMLLPGAGSVAFSYWSHKVLRWLAPFAIAISFVAALFLAREPFYLAYTVVCLAALIAAWFSYWQELRGAPVRSIFAVPYYFLAMNLALMLGFFRFLSGSQPAAWRRTAR
jgi:cellulose synthase/poly-beta-1,6-N-acetylglucosamine synthase-like glycosyltransferase